MPGFFNGEPEFYAAGSTAVPFVDVSGASGERHATASIAPDPLSVELTPQEKEVCRRLGISEQDFAQVRAEELNKNRESQR